jgi:hypothetical protein
MLEGMADVGINANTSSMLGSNNSNTTTNSSRSYGSGSGNSSGSGSDWGADAAFNSSVGDIVGAGGGGATTDLQMYGYAFALSAATFFRVFFLHTGALQQWFSGMEVRAAAIALMFRKLLQLRAENLAMIPSGQLISVISADVERFTMVWFGHSMWLVRCAFFTMDSVVLGLAALGCGCCTVRVFRHKFALENAIGSPACSLEASMHVANDIPLGCSLSYRLTLYNRSNHTKGADSARCSDRIRLDADRNFDFSRGGSQRINPSVAACEWENVWEAET